MKSSDISMKGNNFLPPQSSFQIIRTVCATVPLTAFVGRLLRASVEDIVSLQDHLL